MKTSRRASVRRPRRHPIFLSRVLLFPPPSLSLPFYLQFHSGFEWAASYRGFNVDASARSQKGEATDDGNDSGNWVVTAASPRPIYALLRLNFTPAITLLRGGGGSRAIPETISGGKGRAPWCAFENWILSVWIVTALFVGVTVCVK